MAGDTEGMQEYLENEASESREYSFTQWSNNIEADIFQNLAKVLIVYIYWDICLMAHIGKIRNHHPHSYFSPDVIIGATYTGGNQRWLDGRPVDNSELVPYKTIVANDCFFVKNSEMLHTYECYRNEYWLCQKGVQYP